MLLPDTMNYTAIADLIKEQDMKKRTLLFMFIVTSYLGAMDNAVSWRDQFDTLSARLNGLMQQANNPEEHAHRDSSLEQQIADARQSLSQNLIILAPSSLERAIANHNRQEVIDILVHVPTVIWEKPSGYSGSWVAFAIYTAANNSHDAAVADILEDIAIIIFNRMKQVASDTVKAWINILQNRNPLLVACHYRRKEVLRTLLPDINVEWRGSEDTQSPLEWAQQSIKLANYSTPISAEESGCAHLILNMSYLQAQTPQYVSLPEHTWQQIAYQKQVEEEYCTRDEGLQPFLDQATQQHLGAERKLKQLPKQRAGSKVTYDQPRGQSRRLPTRFSRGVPLGKVFWIKVAVVTAAIYVVKKLYDRYYHKPTTQHPIVKNRLNS